MKKYRILEGKIRMSKKKPLRRSKHPELRIDLKYPPVILAWLNTVSHVLTLSANAKNSTSQQAIDDIARFFRSMSDEYAFDQLFYGYISVKSLQKEARHTQPYKANERLLPAGVTVNREGNKVTSVELKVLRFVDGKPV